MLAWAFHCSGFSRCQTQALGQEGGGSCGSRAQQVGSGLSSTGSVATALGLSSSETREVFLDWGSNPCLLHWQVDSSPLSHQGSPTTVFLISSAT